MKVNLKIFACLFIATKVNASEHKWDCWYVSKYDGPRCFNHGEVGCTTRVCSAD